MGHKYDRVAVIGAGPSGLAATRALSQERAFSYIRCFERKACVGGLWAYNAEPDKFSTLDDPNDSTSKLPPELQHGEALLLEPSGEGLWSKNASYDNLDTNAGARTMAYTHTSLPFANSTHSIQKFGKNNSTRPRHAVLSYLENLWKPFLQLLSLNTHVENVERCEADGKWIVTLRKTGVGADGGSKLPANDLWWQESFDAVIVASGHFSVPRIPQIEGLKEASSRYPSKFEHSKSWRSAENYVNKASIIHPTIDYESNSLLQKVIVVGGGVSAADLSEELHDIVQGSLYLSQRNELEFLRNAWELPGIERRPELIRVYSDDDHRVHAEFKNGSVVSDFDKIIFATGYRLSYPFLPFQAVTPENRLSGFYQHIFRIGHPSLAVIGQVRAAISFRIYEYQSVAVARYFAGRATSELPSISAQEEWEKARLAYKGPTELFHEIKPDFSDYYGWLRDLSGPPSSDSQGYALPVFEDNWVDSDIEVLIAKNEYWGRLAATSTGTGAFS